MGYTDYYKGPLRDYHRDPFPTFPTKHQGGSSGCTVKRLASNLIIWPSCKQGCMRRDVLPRRSEKAERAVREKGGSGSGFDASGAI